MTNNSKSVAILGGAFDPIHLGHLSLAEDTFRELKLDEVWFVPSAQSPLKENEAGLDEKGRLELLGAALEPYPDFHINRFEIDRGGVSYTIDTMKHFTAQYPEVSFYCVIGGDQVAQLHKWKNIDALCKLMTFVIVSRPGYVIDTDQIPAIPNLRFLEVNSRLLDIASSKIRDRIAAGKEVKHLLPKAVSDLILQKHLYRV